VIQKSKRRLDFSYDDYLTWGSWFEYKTFWNYWIRIRTNVMNTDKQPWSISLFRWWAAKEETCSNTSRSWSYRAWSRLGSILTSSQIW
jgi:hypothetical protein